MKIEYLKEFVVLAQSLNFSKASAQLFISQPVLSRHIMLLEKEFDICLFIRNKQSVTLTENGKIFLDEVTDFLVHYQEMCDRISRKTSNNSHFLRLGLLYYSKDLFTEAINIFLKKYPHSQMQFLSKTPIEILNALMMDEIDLGSLLHFNFNGSTHLNLVDITEEPMVLAISKQHRLSSYDKISVQDLKQERLLNVDDLFYKGYYEYIQKEITQLGGKIDPNPILIQDYESLLLAVEVGLGAAILLNTAKKHIGNLGLCIDFKEPLTIKRCLAYKRNNENIAVSNFLKIIRETAHS